MASQDASYIDYETFLSPEFSASAFANSLVLSTNDASDSTLDLSTPLSKTLFDLQEVDTHIHNVSTQSALPLLIHSQLQTEAASRLIGSFSRQLSSLTENYTRLESEVVGRHAAAEQIRLCTARLWVTLRIGRAVSRALALGRRLDAQMAEVRPSLAPGTGARRGDEHRALLAATYTMITLRSLLAADRPGMEGEHLGRLAAMCVLRRDLLEPSESRLKGKAQQIVREFALASLPDAASSSETISMRTARSPSPQAPTRDQIAPKTYAQAAEARSRTTAALVVLYLLSPAPHEGHDTPNTFAPTLLLTALQTYLQTAIKSSEAGLSRALAQLPQLPRALYEAMARCKNIVALEALLRSTEVPEHPGISVSNLQQASHTNNESTDTADARDSSGEEDSAAPRRTFLEPLLNVLDTTSLPSFFWRGLAAGMGGKVTEILSRGGAPARTLRSQKDKIRDIVRDAVLRGCEEARQPDGRTGDAAWEREAAVMVASIVSPMNR